MNKLITPLIVVLCGALFAPHAAAGHKDKKYRASSYSSAGYAYRTARSEDAAVDYADVIAVEPIVRVVTIRVPRQECWEEEVYRSNRARRSNGTAGATIAGGLIGGLIGRQIGGGSGRDAMTVVGTLVGSAVANDRAQARQGSPESDGYYDTVQRCETSDELRQEERIDGYRVTYLYNGREYTTRSDTDPGDRIKVRVSVSPVTRR